jgi:hypothetical protein
MNREVIVEQLETNVTRRRVIKTGAKLAYAAPLVALTYKTTAGSVMAASTVCRGGDCLNVNLCGGSLTCVCRDADGTTPCLQDVFCGDTPQCTSSAQCPGGFCIPAATNCCDDGFGYCVFPCGTGPGIDLVGIQSISSTQSLDTLDSELVAPRRSLLGGLR